MHKYGDIRNVVPSTIIADLQERTLRTIDELHETYFPQMTNREVMERYMHSKPSRFSRAVAYRVFTQETINALVPHLTDAALGFWGDKKFTFYPVFYVRYSLADAGGTHLLDSQPHYDRSFDCYAYSFWVPLVDSNVETGGICLFPDEDLVHEFVQENGNNRFDFMGYMKNADTLDPMIRDKAVTFALSAGDVVTFDSDLLHGATRPTTKPRFSFDVRLLSLDDQKPNCCAPDLIKLFNQHVDCSNAMNLLTLGDPIGAQAIIDTLDINAMPEAMQKTLHDVRASQDLPPSEDLFEGSPWRTEYTWFQKYQEHLSH